MSEENAPVDNKKTQLAAGGTGAGIGTLLVILASYLPEDGLSRQILVYLAPSVTVVSSYLWLMAKRRIDLFVDQSELESILRKARKRYEKAKKIKGADPAHLKKLRERVQEAELLVMKSYEAKIQVLVERA